MAINKYQQAQRDFVKETQRKTSLAAFTNPLGKPATWDDPIWRYQPQVGKHLIYYFTVEIPQKVQLKRFIDYEALNYIKRHLLMIWVLLINAKNIAPTTKRRECDIARWALTQVEHIEDFTTYNIQAMVKGKPKQTILHLHTFMVWLKNNQFIPSHIRLPTANQKAVTGDELMIAKQAKLPEEKVLLALGAIHFEVIPPDESLWNTPPLLCQRDAVFCVLAALGMASPNRIVAEQTILNTQLLQSMTQLVKGKNETVWFLDWKGSKRYKDNRNHILSAMVPAVSRSLVYMQRISEPARILARFYADPSLPLKSILLHFKPSKANSDALKPNMNKPIHLIHLGFLLGFYDNTDGFLPVKKNEELPTIHSKTNKSKCHKPIVNLSMDSELIVNTYSLIKLLGIKTDKVFRLFSKNILTVEAFQNEWISYLKSQLIGFPIQSNNTLAGTVDYRHAMFALTGPQFFIKTKGSSSYIGARSFYALVDCKTIGNSFSRDISMSNQKMGSLFTRYGFSDEFRLMAHQLRHWHNDLAEREGISHAVINLWSGRKNPEQILHYVHREGAERANEISDILFDEKIIAVNKEEFSLNVISQTEYELLTETVATVTSTGFCTQNLTVTPCSFLNNFETQCALCASSCHVAQDTQAIGLLEKDLQVQEHRLKDVQTKNAFMHSKNMQNWFKIHLNNTEILRQLIVIMQDNKIAPGSIIRIITSQNEFRITDLKKKLVQQYKLALPNVNDALAQALALKPQPPKENPLSQILDLI